VEVPTDTLTSILFPKLSERLAKEGPEAGRYLYEKAVGTIAAFMLPVVLFIILFANPLVKFISGPGFGETVPILQVTMLYGLIIPFNRFFGITLDAVGKAKTNFLLVFASAIMNVFSNYFYIRNFGTIGAAYGTLTTYLFMLVYNQAFLHKHMGVRLRNILRHFIGAYTAFFSRGAALLRSFS
jgi:O-antigen/teichoic acid export membrane protein